MGERKLKTGTFKHIESELYHYYETKREITKLKNQILHSTHTPDNTEGGRSNLPSDPTGYLATKLATHKQIGQLERIINAIEIVYAQLPEDKQKLIELKYWTKPQKLTWDGIADKLYISKRQALRWRDDIINVIANTLGWR